MTVTERATQIWPILVLCASRRETLTCDLLAKLIGVPVQTLAEFLEPIRSYCFLEGLAPLTAIVVNQTSGLPGDGSITAPNLPRAHASIFAQEWLRQPTPTAEIFHHASEGMLARRARAVQARVEKRRQQRRKRSEAAKRDTTKRETTKLGAL